MLYEELNYSATSNTVSTYLTFFLGLRKLQQQNAQIQICRPKNQPVFLKLSDQKNSLGFFFFCCYCCCSRLLRFTIVMFVGILFLVTCLLVFHSKHFNKISVLNLSQLQAFKNPFEEHQQQLDTSNKTITASSQFVFIKFNATIRKNTSKELEYKERRRKKTEVRKREKYCSGCIEVLAKQLSSYYRNNK